MISNDNILDKALALAKGSSWEDFSLLELACALEVTLDRLYSHIRSRDDIAELLFDRADQAMLRQSHTPGFLQQPPETRLAQCISVWLNTMSPYKALVREILAYKLEPGHVHLQAHGITRISRTVQWFLTAACWQPKGFSRIAAEIGVTSVYLMTFSQFLYRDSLDSVRLETQLIRRLRPMATKV